MSDKPRCTGTTKTGEPCGSFPSKGETTCRAHDSDDASRTRTEAWDRQRWLDCFEWAGMVTLACELMGVSRNTVYQERQRNEDFALAWADVEERSTECMEREAYRRAVEGVNEPLVSAGRHVTDVKRYSDTLLQFMLKSRRPDRYRERVDVQHGGGVKVEQRVRVDLRKLDEEDLTALERIQAKVEA